MPDNSKAVGDETEITILRHLIAAGHRISIPFGDNDKYDMIVDNGDDLFRVQCKTAWLNSPHTIRFNVHSQTTNDGEYEEISYDGEIDAFIVRDADSDDLYWIDIHEAPEQKMDLRFEAEIDHPSINWAEEYRFSGAIPD